MPLSSLKDLFVQQLQDLYDAENQLVKALPRFAEAISHEEVRNAFEEHGQLTKKHVARLARIFETLGVSAGNGTCHGMKGLVKECERIMAEEAEDVIRDAGLIAAVQRIEHYEISAYSSARTFADHLGYEDFAWSLTQTLDDEREADQRLTTLVDAAITLEAAEAPEVG